MFDEIVRFIQSLYPGQKSIPLHAPIFSGNEKKYLIDCVDSTFVSTVGEYVPRFEKAICEYTKSRYAIATVNGTAALHMALMLVGVEKNTEVLTQALTFVATANAISYIGAHPIFIDSSETNMGMSSFGLQQFLQENVVLNDQGLPMNKGTGRRISACVPMHVFGHVVEIKELQKICQKYSIPLVEDAAESLGSFYEGTHTGLFGDIAILSFNGNKIATCGGGGMILTQNEVIAKRAKHLTTTAKIPHAWEFFHDDVGYNYRLPNINAALGVAQLEQLPHFLQNKRQLAQEYKKFFSQRGISFFDEPTGAQSNFWLNSIQFQNIQERDQFLEFSNGQGVMTRPIWRLMSDLPPFQNCQKTSLKNAQHFQETVVNIPSSVRSL